MKSLAHTGVADWSRAIAFALADGDVVRLMWSQHATASKWVKHEWLTAAIPTNFNLLKRKKMRKLF